MWLNSNALVTYIISTFLLLSSQTLAGGNGEIEVTLERQKACDKADKQYAKYYPDAPLNTDGKLEDGVVIVKLYKYNFCPANVTVNAGETVRWVNVDKRTSHSVWLKDTVGPELSPESKRFFPEESWQFTFSSDGKFPYLCGPHWKDEDMKGFVRVNP